MDIKKCKDCPYFRSYYHGGSVGTIQFSHRCWWTAKDPEKIKEDECKRNSSRRV